MPDSPKALHVHRCEPRKNSTGKVYPAVILRDSEGNEYELTGTTKIKFEYPMGKIPTFEIKGNIRHDLDQ